LLGFVDWALKRAAKTEAEMSFDPNAKVDAQGVWFCMHFPDTAGTAVVTGDTLKTFFGADDDPATWVDTYRAHFRMIHAAAQQKEFATRQHPTVVDVAAIKEAERAT